MIFLGLPELNWTLKKSVSTVVSRTASGILALIVRDSKAGGVYTIYRESDIPSSLGVANTSYVKRAMIGYLSAPSLIYLSVIGAADDIASGFRALAQYSYDYIAGPPEITPEDAAALGTLVKSARKLRYIGKVVLPDVDGDNEGVINFSASGIKSGSATFTGAQYASRIAGVLAGTPITGSATEAPLPEVTDVDAVENPGAAIDAGKLILLNDGRQVKVSRAVTSKHTMAAADPDLLKKIKCVAAIDLIRYYAMVLIEDTYRGKVTNNYDNKCILITALQDFLRGLEGTVLETGSASCALSAAKTREYLLGLATAAGNSTEANRIKRLTDTEIVKEPTDSHVFIGMSGRIVDAMEDFDVSLETV